MTLHQKIDETLEFIVDISAEYDDLHLAFSGGKDSIVLFDLAKGSGIEFEAFYANTTIDPRGTKKFIRENYPSVRILQPQKSFFQLVEKKGFPTRLNRYCCTELKEYASVGKNVLMGVRKAESRQRSQRKKIHKDTRPWQKGAVHIYPLLDWTDADIWLYIQQKNLKVAPAYYNGFSRLGCVGCPLVYNSSKREQELNANPQIKKALIKNITRGMAKNPQWKITILSGGDGNIAYNWWLSGKTMQEYFIDSYDSKNFETRQEYFNFLLDQENK